MSFGAVESRGWARSRWMIVIGVILLIQFALIFWLAGHGPPPKPPVAHLISPRVVLPAETHADSISPADPTFFVRANPNGFSGRAWMQNHTITYEHPVWTDSAPPSNDLPVQHLGESVSQYLQTNSTAATELVPPPKPVVPVIQDTTAETTQSTLSIEGALAGRALARPVKLQSWPATETTDVLSNSVVQTGVDEEGSVFSAVLVISCGSKEADANALALARGARFVAVEPDPKSPKTQTWGRMIFHWHTVSMAATNSLVLKP